MSLQAPTQFQDSFFQRKSRDHLEGLDLRLNRWIGKWKRRRGVLNSWWSLVYSSEEVVKTLEFLSDKEINGLIVKRKSEVGLGKGLTADSLGLICEVARRELKLSPYQVQMLSAVALIKGYLAEIDTGEGKTLSIALAAAFEAWTGEPVHVITANDYLAVRDERAMRSFYSRLKLSTSAVVGKTQPNERREGYRSNITYTTAKEVAADYLRDRLQLGEWNRSGIRQHVRKFTRAPGSGVSLTQRGLFRALIDEADNALIDEAITPLLISQKIESEELRLACLAAWEIAKSLTLDQDYRVNHSRREVLLLTSGGDKALNNNKFPDVALWLCPQRQKQMISLALEAREFFSLGAQYIIEGGKVVIIDESTGRPMPDRSWKLGLHQIIEAKEGVEITAPSATIAQISFQRFFQKYGKLSGATGTAKEIADEIWTVYGIATIRIPRNLPNVAKLGKEQFYLSGGDRDHAVVAEIISRHQDGQPVLVGTRTVSSSEDLGRKLTLKNINHVILNATKLPHEARIVAEAGLRNRVTIATNMAGRGTDIELGHGVKELGGLHVIATELHEARRVDRQLFGRSGRQGDPGSVSRHYALNDVLFVTFLPSWIRSLVSKAARPETGQIMLPGVCRFLLKFVQWRAEKISFFQRIQVAENDRQQRASLGFSKE